MITTPRFTPTWFVAGLFVLAGCGDKTPKQASAKESVPAESTVTPVQPAGEPAAVAPAPAVPVSFAGADSAYRSRRYGDAASGSYIGRRDQSSTQQARAQGLEISFTAGFKTSSPMLVVRFARNGDILSPRSAFYRPAESGCGAHNTGNRGNASERLLKIRALTFR